MKCEGKRKGSGRREVRKSWRGRRRKSKKVKGKGRRRAWEPKEKGREE